MVPATAFQLLSSCKFSSGKKVLENAFKNNIWAKPLTQLESKQWEPEDSRAYTDNNIHERLLLDARIFENRLCTSGNHYHVEPNPMWY